MFACKKNVVNSVYDTDTNIVYENIGKINLQFETKMGVFGYKL